MVRGQAILTQPPKYESFRITVFDLARLMHSHHFLMGNSTINGNFNSYVSLPEGKYGIICLFMDFDVYPCMAQGLVDRFIIICLCHKYTHHSMFPLQLSFALAQMDMVVAIVDLKLEGLVHTQICLTHLEPALNSFPLILSHSKPISSMFIHVWHSMLLVLLIVLLHIDLDMVHLNVIDGFQDDIWIYLVSYLDHVRPFLFKEKKLNQTFSEL